MSSQRLGLIGHGAPSRPANSVLVHAAVLLALAIFALTFAFSGMAGSAIDLNSDATAGGSSHMHAELSLNPVSGSVEQDAPLGQDADDMGVELEAVSVSKETATPVISSEPEPAPAPIKEPAEISTIANESEISDRARRQMARSKRAVIFSSDNSPMYSFFLPIAAWLWKWRIGYDPVILISKDLDPLLISKLEVRVCSYGDCVYYCTRVCYHGAPVSVPALAHARTDAHARAHTHVLAHSDTRAQARRAGVH